MRVRLAVLGGAAAIGIAAVAGVGAGAAFAQAPRAPSIEGTYRLVSRTLPDGTKQSYPEVCGLLTFTREHRNFNVFWRDDAGKSFSASSISEYRLTDREFSEKSVYRMVHDEIGGKPVAYDFTGASGTSPVTSKEGRIEFQFPLHGEPSVVFEKGTLTATRPGAFVDHWEKVR